MLAEVGVGFGRRTQMVQIDRRRIEEDRRNDGRWVLVTNSSLPADQVSVAYKGAAAGREGISDPEDAAGAPARPPLVRP